MKHWQIDQLAWDRFDPAKVDPAVVALVKAAAMVERNGTDYATYLNRVFARRSGFLRRRRLLGGRRGAARRRARPLGRACRSRPGTSQPPSPATSAGYHLPLDAPASVRGSRTGELIARCMVETGTSSYYTALAESTDEPVLRQICQLIAADEFRHYKLFYDHMRRYLARERIGMLRRLRIAAGRIGESEDDELAYAWHCGNEAADLTVCKHDRCSAPPTWPAQWRSTGSATSSAAWA